MKMLTFEYGCPFCRAGDFLVRSEFHSELQHPDNKIVTINGMEYEQGDYEDDFNACGAGGCEMRCCLACVDPLRSHRECLAAAAWLRKKIQAGKSE